MVSASRVRAVVALGACAAWIGTAVAADPEPGPGTGPEALDAYAAFAAQLDASSGFGITVESTRPEIAAGRAVALVRAWDAPDAPVVGRLSQRIEPAPGAFPGGPPVGLVRVVTVPLADGAPVGAAPGASMTSLVGLDRRTAHVLSAERWRLRLGVTGYAGEGLAYGFTTSPDGSLGGTGRLGRAEFDDGAFRAEVRGLSDVWAFALPDEGPYRQGEYAATADALVLEPERSVSLGLEDVSLDVSTSVARGRLDALASFDAVAVDAPPGVDVASATLRLSGLDVAGTFDYLRALEEALYDAPPDGIDEAMAGMRVRPAAMLLPGAALELEARLGDAADGVDLTLELALDGDGPLPGTEGTVTVGDVLGAASGSLLLEADPAALERTPAAPYLELARALPWVDTRRERWRARVTLADATLRVNGLPVPLAAVLGADAMSLPLERALAILRSAGDD